MPCSGFGLQAQAVPEEQHSPGTAGEIKAIANQVGWDKMKENKRWSVKTEFDEATSVLGATTLPPRMPSAGPPTASSICDDAALLRLQSCRGRGISGVFSCSFAAFRPPTPSSMGESQLPCASKESDIGPAKLVRVSLRRPSGIGANGLAPPRKRVHSPSVPKCPENSMPSSCPSTLSWATRPALSSQRCTVLALR